MDIRYLGHSSFRLSSRGVFLVTDPFDPKSVGLPFPKISASIVTISHDHSDHSNSSIIDGDPLIIAGPGEYEVKEVRITGLPTFHDTKKGEKRGKNTIYSIIMEGINIVHLGDLGHKLKDHQIEDLGEVDILMVPVGGYYTIDSKIASEVVSQLKPRIVIPMHYKRKGLVKELAKQLEPIEFFLKEMGVDTVKPQFKLKTNKKTLPEELEVVILKIGK